MFVKKLENGRALGLYALEGLYERGGLMQTLKMVKGLAAIGSNRGELIWIGRSEIPVKKGKRVIREHVSKGFGDKYFALLVANG